MAEEVVSFPASLQDENNLPEEFLDRFLRRRSADVEVAVGSGGDFADVNEAVAYLVERYYPVYIKEGFAAKVKFLNGHQPKVQLLIRNLDLSWITFVKELSYTPKDIASVDPGDKVDGIGEEAVVEIEIDTDEGDASDLYAQAFTIRDGVVPSPWSQNEKHYFWFHETEAENDPELDGTGHFVEIASTDSDAEVATKLAAAINTVDRFTATVEGPVVTVTNAEEGQVSVPTSTDEKIIPTVINWGEDPRYQVKVTTTEEHGLTDQDLIVIKGQWGEHEEMDYNGLHRMVPGDTPDTLYFDLDYQFDNFVYYDPIRAALAEEGQVCKYEPVVVERDQMTTQFEGFYYPFIGVYNGKAPIIDCIFEQDESGSNDYMSYLDGLCLTDNAEAQIQPFAGFRNFGGSNIYGTRGSRINANDAFADGAKRHGIWAYSSTVINARRAIANNCGSRGASEDRGDGFDDAGRPIGCGIFATRSSIINAEGARTKNCYGDNILATYGGKINVGGHEAKPVSLEGDNTKGLAFNTIAGEISGLGERAQNILIARNHDPNVLDFMFPGPQKLIAGNRQCGFFGEVSVEELFGTAEDSTYLFTNAVVPDGAEPFGGEDPIRAGWDSSPGWEGTLLREDRNWLKFMWRGKVIFIAKTTLRRSISWDNIYRMGAVYGTGEVLSAAEEYMLQNAEPENFAEAAHAEEGKYYGEVFGRTPQTAHIELNGITYRLRLLTGSDEDPTTALYGRPGIGKNNEWNRLILPLHERAKNNSWLYPAYAPTHTPDWAVGYTDVDLAAIRFPEEGGEILGSYNWCQNFDPHDARRRVVRGFYGASYLYSLTSWLPYTGYGLRPVLEPLLS
jgi:hypothetical protein